MNKDWMTTSIMLGLPNKYSLDDLDVYYTSGTDLMKQWAAE